ncbi:Bud site selection protein 6, partial [Coemansia sp. RSA 2322]
KGHTDEAIGLLRPEQAAAPSPSSRSLEDPPAIARSASQPATSGAEIIELHARVQRLELALSVERQARHEEVAAAEQAKTEAVAQLEKLQSAVSRHPNVLRVRIEEGKDMLKNEYRLLNTRFEDVHALVQEMRKDVAQRGSTPSSQLMRKANTELKGIETGSERLVAFINETRSDWKRTWEEELQNILKEQGFVKDVEQMLGELLDDTQHLNDVTDKLDKIIDLKLRERAKDDYVPPAATKFIDVVSPDDAPDAKKDFLMQISCVDVDHQRRLDALKSAERLRQTELAAKVNEFDEELSDFVTQRKLRKTGGTQELERRRAEKEVEVMKEMLKSVEEAEQARRAKLAQRKAGKPVIARLKWGQEYKGLLVSTDSYMNLQLVNAEEFQDGNSMGELPGELLIRCNNILYVRETSEETMDKDSGAVEESTVHDEAVSEDEQMEDGEQA